MGSASRIILIDAHALCYRAFYAVKDLRNSKGSPTNAVFGFVNILKKILSRYQPIYVAACFDVGRHTKRKDKFAAYKAKRVSMPEDLAVQIPVIKDIVTAFRIPIFAIDGYEADDVIAVLARRFAAQDKEVIIVSDDKDLHQLLSSNVRIYSSRRDALLGPEDTEERFGVTPGQMVDYLALAGDVSDNIPGVDGIGEVTAQKLIKQYGSLDNLFANVDTLNGKLKEKILNGREAALLSRELTTLDMDTPVNCDLTDIQWPGPDTVRLKEIFNELEFRVLMDELKSHERSSPPLPVAETFEFMNSGDAPALVKAAIATGRAAFLIDDENQVFVAAGNETFKCPVDSLSAVREILDSSRVLKIFYDAKAVRHAFSKVQVRLVGEIFDVLLAGYLLNAGQASYSLKSLAWSLGQTVPDGEVVPAVAVKMMLALHEPLLNVLKERDLFDLYRNIEYPLSQVLFEMEQEGVTLDVRLLEELSRDSETKIKAMIKRVHALAGEEFNCNSSKQLGHILFEKLKLPVSKKTKTGISTDEEVLKKLAPLHELPGLILEYRQLAKLKSTYIDALPKMVSPVTRRIHCSFNQTGAETGRLSSSNPNLQNIPIRTEEGRMIRRAFIPSAPGRVLLAADYSQIELRLLAHLADDPVLKQAFLKGEDIHTFTAALIFDVAQQEVTSEMRYKAKRINFGIIYGMSAFGLAKDLAIGQKEAQIFIDRYFLRYPGIMPFMQREIEKARALGYGETMFKRRRYLPDLQSKNPAVRHFAERQAINTPLQGSAADIIKMAMIRMADEIKNRHWQSRMIITVHDELVFDVPDKELKTMALTVRAMMQDAALLSIPVLVTVDYGPNWAEMQKI